MLVRRDSARGSDGRRGTYAVGEVCNQVFDFDLANLQLTVQPVERSAHGFEVATHGCGCGAAHHFVKVFCWTLTHCCSRGAMVVDMLR